MDIQELGKNLLIALRGYEMKSLTNQKYWNDYWDTETRGEDVGFYFSELIDNYISWENITPKSYMEIGGAPGNIMAYMSKEHQLFVSTVDFTDKQRIENVLNKHQIEKYKIIEEDFRTFNVAEDIGKWGVVASWGFLEHFEKEVTSGFINKQKQMVSDGGYLIIEMPNIRRLMWLVYWIFNRKLLKIHNFKIMDMGYLKKEVLKTGDFELLYASYYFTMNHQNSFFKKHKRLEKISEQIVMFFNKHNFHDEIKKWFFPYIVLIGRKVGLG